MSIGQTLKDARSDKGLTLDDLQQNTKIQKRYLIAIEEDNFDALPGDFYVRAFVKQYAEAVDLDSKELLRQLAEQTGQVKEETPVEEVTSRTKKREIKESKEGPSKLDTLYTYLPTIIIVAAVLLIVGSIYFVTVNNKKSEAQIDSSSSKVAVSSDVSSSSKKKAISSEKKASTKSSSSTKNSSSSATSQKKAKQTTKKTSKTKQKITNTQSSGSTFTYELTGAKTKQTIKLSADAAAWMAVSYNGSQQWQGTLSSGGSHTVTVPAGTETITFNLGNSKATSITINGQKFDFLKEDAATTVRTLVVNVKD